MGTTPKGVSKELSLQKERVSGTDLAQKGICENLFINQPLLFCINRWNGHIQKKDVLYLDTLIPDIWNIEAWL